MTTSSEKCAVGMQAAGIASELTTAILAEYIAETTECDVLRASHDQLLAACKVTVAKCCECNGTGVNMMCARLPCSTCTTARVAIVEAEKLI